jgi:hypothetical protein
MADTIEVRVGASRQASHHFVFHEANRLLLRIHGDECEHSGTVVPLAVWMDLVSSVCMIEPECLQRRQ